MKLSNPKPKKFRILFPNKKPTLKEFLIFFQKKVIPTFQDDC